MKRRTGGKVLILSLSCARRNDKVKNEHNFRRILLIDDLTDYTDFAKKNLLKHDYDVRTTGSVRTGLRLVQEKAFPLVLVDLKKVEDNKGDFKKIAEIQSDKNYIVVVMFPTELTPGKMGEIFTLGAHDCMDKPYEGSKLFALVEAQLNNNAAIPRGVPKNVKLQKPKILIIEDDKDWRERLAGYLPNENYQLEVAGKYPVAERLLKEKSFNMIVLDLRLIEDSEDFEGMRLLRLLQEREEKMPVIIVSAHGTVEHVKDAFKTYHIHDYLSKQEFNRGKYQETVKKALNYAIR